MFMKYFTMARFRSTIVMSTLFLAVTSSAQAQTSFDHSHSGWDKLLQTYVVDKGPYSQVKYAQLKQQGLTQLNDYLQMVSAVSSNQFAQWSKSQRLAFLINAYNAFTVKIIVDNYPVTSIKDIGSFFRNTWKIKFFTLFGENTYLDHIEHELIRGNDEYSEPRIHFALVCASVGCPKLQPRAFTAANLHDMLELGVKTFLTDASRNRYNASQKTLELSSIFKWYGGDFVKDSGSVENYVAPYITQDLDAQRRIKSGDTMVKYLDYDWSLNDVK